MGFLSGLKKVGKVALKVAPYAAMAIPGIGPLASMAIQGGIGAANGAMGGGGLKGALLGGAIGAGTGALTKGLGPSAGSVKNAVSQTANKAVGGGLKGTLLNVGKQTAANMLMPKDGGQLPTGINGPIGQEGQHPSIFASLPGVIDKIASARRGQPPTDPTGASGAGTMPRPGAMPAPSDQYPGGFGPNFGEDQNNPNLANSINQGKLDAQKYRRPPMGIPLQRQYGY